MNLSAEIPFATELDNALIPDCLKEDLTTIKKEGFDGEALILIFQNIDKALQTVSNIVTIAGFIYVLIHDYKAKVNAAGSVISSAATKDEIEKKLSELKSPIDPNE